MGQQTPQPAMSAATDPTLRLPEPEPAPPQPTQHQPTSQTAPAATHAPSSQTAIPPVSLSDSPALPSRFDQTERQREERRAFEEKQRQRAKEEALAAKVLIRVESGPVV